jgi:hypothetical protein
MFPDPHHTEKLVVPFEQPYSEFFRNLFSHVRQHIDSRKADPELISDYLWGSEDRSLSWEERVRKQGELIKAYRIEMYNELYNAVKREGVVQATEYQTFNFYGQTVFVNHPSGEVNLSNFQNNSNQTEENKP